jgi:cyclic beta-1,2-glucan synthetase
MTDAASDLPEPAKPTREAQVPIRLAQLHDEGLAALGERLAREGVSPIQDMDVGRFHARIKDNAMRTSAVYREINEAQGAGETVTPAAQWLLDNYYLVEESVSQVMRDLPARFFKQLPLMPTRDGKSVPRVLTLAWAYVAHTDSTASPKMLKAMVDGFQSVQPMQIGELWALPSLVRFVLLENLRRLALRVKRARDMRRAANEAADRVLAAGDGGGRERILDGYKAHARDATFATQLLYRLRDGSQNAGRALHWLEKQLESFGSDAERIIQVEHQTLSSGNVTTGNIIRSLRLINDIDWTVWFEGVSRIDELMRAHGNFAELDFQSRDQYRTAIEKLSQRSGRTEYEVAQAAVEIARKADSAGDSCADIGFFLVGYRRPELEAAIGYRQPLGLRFKRFYQRSGWFGIAAPVAVLTVAFMFIAALGLDLAGLSSPAIVLLMVMFALPASEAAIGLFNTLVLLQVEPRRLIGYEYKNGVPPAARTLVVIPTMIGSRADVEDSVRNLEIHYLANAGGAIHYAVLSDWPDSSAEQEPADLELVDYARGLVRQLNQRYPGEGDAPRFHLLHRRRLYNEAEDRWMGWERKRGKLHELNLLLRGDGDTTFLPPEAPLPAGIVNVLTLDADTRMTRDVVKRLAGKMAHPLNTPRLDPASRTVTGGYGILQPRITASLTTGDEASFYQRVFSANRGLDPYVFAVSDVYQDLFGEGTFTGKGLYRVDAMEAALAGRIEENQVLSHDLLEGAFARAALVSDVELVEDYPTRYSVDASRNHRWARGDWQLLGFLFGARSGVPALSRWKMADNLRRSLVPIFWVGASLAGWSLLPLSHAAIWQSFLIVSLFVAPTFDIISHLVPRSREVTLRGHISAVIRDIAFGTAQVALKIVLIAHSAWMMGDAIVRTLYRMHVSRRNLLEWRTASQARKDDTGDIRSAYRAMWGGLVVAAACLAIAFLAGNGGRWVALVFCLLWIAAPAFAWVISRSAATDDRLAVAEPDRRALRAVARRTWLYFQTFVTREHNMLPPDNFQETPEPVVANRTSPTNIGVYLLSVISARDFGWTSLSAAVQRLEDTVSTIERMHKHRGHLYNWYDTQTLQPLLPLYVSAVDSGNLAGHLIAVSSACEEWAQAPAAYLEGDFEGVLDVVGILDDTLDDVPDDRRALRPLRQRLRERIEGMRRAVDTIRNAPETAAIRTINLTVLAGEIGKLAGAINRETGSAKTRALTEWARELAMTCESHFADAHTDEASLEMLRERLDKIAVRARTLAFEMDFSFLLNEDRKLLSIGYRVNEHLLDESCYDLLASEARLASLFAIAKGDVPTEHWFRLGRPIVEIGFRGALMSWAGSMFEYLMPPLVMNEPQGGILNQTNNLIIRRQIAYARSKNVPWGISEAAYNGRDREMTYQYTNFGVPGLGLKRGLAHNLVIAPYATVLASQYVPREAVRNFERLKAAGGMGSYGFYDALDYTPQRVPEGATHAVVRNYMAHHQGMSIVAAANVVFEGRMRDRFHRDPVIEAAELLLQEKAPRDIPAATIRTEAAERGIPEGLPESGESRLVIEPARAPRSISLLSNGRYHVMVTATGSGSARLGDVALTRWRPDPTEDRLGTYIFLRDTESGEWWSATTEPRRTPQERSFTVFGDDKASFHKTVGTLRSEVECIVASEADGEGRRVTLVNEGTTDRHIELTSFAELALAQAASDNAHPAFSKLFVETEIAADNSMIRATRRKRDRSDPDVMLAHFVVDGSGGARATEAETDRRAFIGRGRDLSRAAAFDPGARLSGARGFVLDPIFSLRRQVRVPANKKVSITFWTVAGSNGGEVDAAIAQLNHPDCFARQAMLAWTRSQVQTRHFGVSLTDAASIQKLAGHLVYPDAALRAPAETVAADLAAQSALWPLGISGDFPILALRIDDIGDIAIVKQAIGAQEYFRAHGLSADLVIVNEQAASYSHELQNVIENLCEHSRVRGHEHVARPHIFAVRRDLMDGRTHRALLAAARVVLHARNGTVYDQIARMEQTQEGGEASLVRSDTVGREKTVAKVRASRPADGAGNGEDLTGWNGYGGFSADGAEYVVRLAGTDVTPQPWINVIANERFGFHVSAEGAGFTWSRNSRDFQLTPWSNDPVVNRPGEAFYVFDNDRNAAFSPLAGVLRDEGAVYEARHGQGYSVFSRVHDGLEMELTQIVDPADPVKLTRLTFRNRREAPARLRVYAYAEWVLGNDRGKTAPNIVPAWNAGAGVLTAQNPYSLEFGSRTAFVATDDVHSVSADRAAFIGRQGSVVEPAAVLAGAALSGTVEPGADPCAAMMREIEVPAGGETTTLWLLGDAASPDAAAELARKHRAADFDKMLEATKARWNDFLGAIEVKTPDPALDAMVNRWLPYQAVACRIRARSAFYQASGAYGFRDQLQDTLSLMLHDPSLARAQILNAAGRQFPQGDVQHWWLPGDGTGVRTMISDDVVWLAHATAHYVRVTGDAAILDESLCFIEGRALEEGEHDAFFTPERSAEKAALYEHCARALDLAVSRTSADGLPLILGGDWNDGMNRVGEKGKGESVWLGWFLLAALRAFTPIADGRGDATRAEAWRAHAEALKAAIEDKAWDGEWYRRGSFDDGSPLGSNLSTECRIDSLAQSWAVLSGEGDPERARRAMDAVLEHLVDDDAQIVRLFTPPFTGGDPDPGYIRSYPPGVRENGGQYTHAATWVVLALAALGRGDDAYRCFTMLNPATHGADRAIADIYRVEPYVVAADIYSEGPLLGRGGWTWYTGSAGWLHRAAVEGILGIRREGAALVVDPALPEAWDGYEATLRLGGTTCRITVRRGAGAGTVSLGGRKLGPVGTAVALPAEGECAIEVLLPEARSDSRRAKGLRLVSG